MWIWNVPRFTGTGLWFGGRGACTTLGLFGFLVSFQNVCYYYFVKVAFRVGANASRALLCVCAYTNGNLYLWTNSRCFFEIQETWIVLSRKQQAVSVSAKGPLRDAWLSITCQSEDCTAPSQTTNSMNGLISFYDTCQEQVSLYKTNIYLHNFSNGFKYAELHSHPLCANRERQNIKKSLLLHQNTPTNTEALCPINA